MNIIRFILILIVALMLGHAASAQCDHTSGRMSRFDQSGFAPAQITSFDGRVLNTRYFDDVGVTERTYHIDQVSLLPQNFSADYKNKFFWLIYSRCDNYVFAVYDPTPEQLKVFRSYLPK